MLFAFPLVLIALPLLLFIWVAMWIGMIYAFTGWIP
jgi:UPF0716 family protein affecting phage T7 exclusion